MPYGCSRIGYAANYVNYAGGVTFEADTLAAWVPFDVNFSAISGFEVIDWNWEYGDGNIGSGQNPTHTYEIAGTYDVTCQIITTDGVKSKTRGTSFDSPTSVGIVPVLMDAHSGPSVMITSKASGALPLFVR